VAAVEAEETAAAASEELTNLVRETRGLSLSMAEAELDNTPLMGELRDCCASLKRLCSRVGRIETREGTLLYARHPTRARTRRLRPLANTPPPPLANARPAPPLPQAALMSTRAKLVNAERDWLGKRDEELLAAAGAPAAAQAGTGPAGLHHGM
jgi:hypothetical protein